MSVPALDRTAFAMMVAQHNATTPAPAPAQAPAPVDALAANLGIPLGPRASAAMGRAHPKAAPRVVSPAALAAVPTQTRLDLGHRLASRSSSAAKKDEAVLDAPLTSRTQAEKDKKDGKGVERKINAGAGYVAPSGRVRQAQSRVAAPANPKKEGDDSDSLDHIKNLGSLPKRHLGLGKRPPAKAAVKV